MYKPAPLRPTKTSISRSRNGCMSCRQKKSKCDEKKPSCSTCARLGHTCEFIRKPFQFRITTLRPGEQTLRTGQSESLLRSIQPSNDGTSIDPRDYSAKIVPCDTLAGYQDGNHLASFSHPTKWETSFPSEAYGQLSAFSCGPEGLASKTVSQPEDCTEEFRPRRYSRVVLHAPLSRSWLQSDTVLLYVTHWEKNCLFALGPMFSQLSTRMELCPVLHYAILAFSACNLSRALPEPSTSFAQNDRNFTHRPHQRHLLHSQIYYNSAIRRLSQLSHADYRSNLLSVLGAILLFCYMESSLCNFRGHYCHVNGISRLLKRDAEDVKTKFNRGELLATWAQAKCYNWWIRIHFSTLDFQSGQSALHLSHQDHDANEPRRASRAVLLSILCESYRLSSKAFLQWWKRQKSSTQSIDGLQDSDRHENYQRLLHQESEKLEEWRLKIEVSEMPIEPIYSTVPNTWTLSSAHSRLIPFHFSSHEASINYAYYAAARIMQSFRIEDEMVSNSPITNNIENDYWAVVFLRVIQGIDHSNCVRENSYTIGISGLVLACILRSTRLITGLLMETWLKTFQDAQVFEEGSLPISQIVAITSMINRQRRAGYDIFAISPTFEDGGGIGKFESYSNQSLSEVVAFGRHRQMGSAFSDCVLIRSHNKEEL